MSNGYLYFVAQEFAKLLNDVHMCVFLLLQVVYIYGASFPQGEPIITGHELRLFMRSAYFYIRHNFRH